MKKNWIISLFGLLACLAAMPLAAAEPAAIEKMKAGKDVTEIVLDLDGDMDVTLVKTADTFGIEDLKFKGAEGDPLSIERKDGMIRLSLRANKKFWKFKVRSLEASFRLLVPEGKDIMIAGGKLKLSGELSGKNIKISAGSLTAAGLVVSSDGDLKVSGGDVFLDMTLRGAKKFKVASGSVSGKVRIPESVEFKNASGSNKLQVMLLEGK